MKAALRDSRVGGHDRWALLQKREIPDLLNPDDVYLTRWRLLATPFGSIYLHQLHADDNDRVLHDHPWTFISIILRGGYVETWADSRLAAFAEAQGSYVGRGARAAGRVRERTWRPGSVHRIRRGEFHSIRELRRTPTWTLLFVGPRRHEWGYATETGWVRFDDYHRRRRAEALAAKETP